MEIRSSLRSKSILALSLYLCFFLAIIGSVTYFVVEPLVRSKIEQNLDLRTDLLAAQIEGPLNSSLGLLDSLVGFAQGNPPPSQLSRGIANIIAASGNIVSSGGLWPEPELNQAKPVYRSLFFNKTKQGGVAQVHLYNNPESNGYHLQPWYQSVANQPSGQLSWSQVYIDPYTQVQMITASKPYYINGQFVGVATVDLSLQALFDFIRKHTEIYQLGVTISALNGSLITEYNYSLVRGRYVSQIELSDFHWQMKVVSARQRISDEVFNKVLRVEWGILPFLLICVLAGYYLFNRYLIAPIITIAQSVDNSKTGGIVDIDYQSDDEIKHLIDAFNEKTVYLEAEKVKAQASTNAKTAFLATLSHEIRTPMNGVLGTAQLLLKTPLTDEQKKHLKTLYDSGDHMMTLLNEILDYSKIEQGHMEFDLAPFPFDSIIGSVNSIYYTLCAEKGLQFRVYSQVARDRWYHADRARLRQILFNLLNNAVKFTSHGVVEVYLEEVLKGGLNYLVIKVKDTGIGIPIAAQKRIFRPFEQAESSTTRRYGGTGLGLAIVKKIVEKLGGKISVSSQEGLGSCFSVELPLQVCEAGSVEQEQNYHLDYQGLTVLIVEDNRTNAIILETFMRNKGFVPTCVENGQEALDLLPQQSFDLILMDNHMPVLDGIETIRAIRAMPNTINQVLIFGCTADVFKETRACMCEAGANHIIAKPVVEKELDDALFRYADLLYQYRREA
ncbi:hybrid sensor histidine kinase/response regulator [Vibrio navarrensis]|uniref:hybrid sensor histidine kinase/response regulator n=1 Tax=Vibrio navarrensis TaxID=29495 RepID=UPI00186A25D2|nr:hybrid sensor histidine kinase/response regulator [Vibrio navarrensis]MBE4580075.1 histidine kinase [Vibrio navarrensis]MBE4606278.1 histidine kinase [Vibrio navarrensis]MBE4610052.1 histidine kinase [Vibrio navarrensis]